MDLPDLGPMTPPASFLAAAEDFGVAFEPGELTQLGRFLGLLLWATERINLTAIRDPEQAWHKHILDGLTLLPVLAELPAGARLADVGSGGGVPGLVVAIARPDLHLTLIESTGKKVGFLRGTIRALGLTNVEVVQGRSEDLGQERGARTDAAGESRRSGAFRESFDAVIARAVGPLSVVAELTVPLCAIGGMTLLVKGERAADELAQARKALEALHAVHEGNLQTPTGTIVVLGKRSATPRVYPRAPGEPKRRPLGG